MEIKYKLNKLFMSPCSTIGNWIRIIFLFSIAVGSFDVFYLIKFTICVNSNCSNPGVLSLLNTVSPLFIIYGFACFLIANFFYRNKLLSSLYADSITLVAGFGFFIMGMLIFSL